MELDATFKNNLSWFIKQSGKSQKTLALELSVHENMMSHYVRGRVPVPAEPHYNLRERLADYFGVSPEKIFPTLDSPNESCTPITPHPKTVIQHASFMVQSGKRSPTTDEAIILILPSVPSQGESELLDCFTWFGQKGTDIRSLITDPISQPFSCRQLQLLTRTKIERMLMPRFQDHDDNDVRLSRRTALATLATLSSTLLTKAQAGQWSAFDIEEFLAQCAQSITACHYLMRDDGLATVAYTLPRYLPILSLLAEQKTLYQKQAADLAAQGHRLSSLLALHRMDFTERVRECHRMLHFSKISGNENLIVFSMILFGVDFLQENPKAKDPEKSLYWYQQAEQLSKHISPLLKSKLFIHLGRVHAQCGHIQEALKYMRLAQEVFPDLPEDDEFAMLENSSSLAMWEGNIYLDLGRLADQHGQPHRAKVLYEASWDTIAQLETSPAKLTMPKRLYIETVNLSAQAAISLQDLDRFEHALLAALQGAKELGSHKRYDEASANWKAARQIWGKETKILDLAEALIDCKPLQLN